MNETMQAILNRRSIRSYMEKPIPKEELDQIVKAALYAPSGKNLQTWRFTVVTDKEKIRKLAAMVGEKLGRENYDMYDPQVLIIPSNDKASPYGREDNACAMENIFLAAQSFGIGSVWINQVRDVCEDPEVRILLDAWEIPANHEIFGIAALGYAKDTEVREVNKTGKVHYVC